MIVNIVLNPCHFRCLILKKFLRVGSFNYIFFVWISYSALVIIYSNILFSSLFAVRTTHLSTCTISDHHAINSMKSRLEGRDFYNFYLKIGAPRANEHLKNKATSEEEVFFPPL